MNTIHDVRIKRRSEQLQLGRKYVKYNYIIVFIDLHKKSLEELHGRYENEKRSLLEEMKHNFGRMRDIFARDDERLELMSIVFEARNDDDTQQTHANFEDSIAVLNNEVCPCCDL